MFVTNDTVAAIRFLSDLHCPQERIAGMVGMTAYGVRQVIQRNPERHTNDVSLPGLRAGVTALAAVIEERDNDLKADDIEIAAAAVQLALDNRDKAELRKAAKDLDKAIRRM